MLLESLREHARPLLDAIDPRRRRVTRAGDHLHIEMRLPPCEEYEAFADDLRSRLSALPGAGSVHVNHALARVVIEIAASQTIEQEAERVVLTVEQTHGIADLPFQRSGTDHPGDAAALARVALELGADGAALLMALSGRFLGLGVIPFEIDVLAALATIRGTPRVRETVDRFLGGQVAELLLTTAGAIAQGIAQRPLGPTIDIAYRALVGAELLARRAAWLGQEASLFDAMSSAPGDARTRPVPLPLGPIESFAEKAVYGAFSAFGVGLAATRDLAASAAPLVGGTPRPAHLGRQAFAAWLGRALSARGIVVIDPAALRRLDRVDTVVLDGRLLANGRLEPGVVVPLAPPPLDDLAARAAALLDPHDPLSPSASGDWLLEPVDMLATRLGGEIAMRLAAARVQTASSGPILALSKAGAPQALLAIRHAADPDLDGVLRAVRRAGLTLRVLATDAHTRELVPENALLEVAGETGVADAIHDLQRAGKVVCLVSGTAEGLTAADVAIGIRRDASTVPWGAHVLCSSALEDARILLEACAPARDASHQSVYVAEAAAAVSVLLALGGMRWTTTAQVASAVDVANLVALLNGIRLGARAAAPPPAVRRDQTPWHALSTEHVLARLHTSVEGLSSVEARRRHRATVEQPGWLARFATAMGDELAGPLTPFLGIAAALSAAVGSATDAVMVGGVAAFDAALGAIQRVTTERQVAQLGETERRAVRVLRDGNETTLEAEALVAGDVIRLEAGDVVPADCRILHGHMLEADESSLTGESLPVTKHPAPCFASVVAERSSMLYAGTSIAAGRARAVVVATGDATEAQRAREIVGGRAPEGGVELRLRALLDVATPVAVASGAIVGVSGLLHGRPLREIVSSAVGLAVAAVPEGLAMVSTMAQLGSARRLSQRGALVQNVRAIEALGRIDVLCLDKTGTVTDGHISLGSVSDGDLAEDVDVLTSRGRSILAAARRATPTPADGRKAPHPTDRALLRAAEAAAVAPEDDLVALSTAESRFVLATDGAEGLQLSSSASAPGPADERGQWHSVAELPFEPARSYHAVLGSYGGAFRLSVKGAPEVVLPRCSAWLREGAMVAIDEQVRRHLVEKSLVLARRGLRVLAVAERMLHGNGSLTDERVTDLALRGFVALSDRVRPTARGAIDTLKRAGARVVMMTGDHPSTAERIAAELGLLADDGVLTGPEIDRMDDAELEARLPGAVVIARLTPAHKVRLVEAYQRLGHVVGMTGDGANDAPAIRLAHVGIALGTRATTAARTAADVVITDDRIETLVDAVIEGRGMWASVRDAISVLVGGNLGEALFIVSSSVLTGSSPLNARQLLLVNLLTDAAPAMAIALRPPPSESPEALLREGPESSLGRSLENDILARGIATAGGTAAAWLAARVTGRAARASTVAFATTVGSQLGQTLVAGGRSPLVIASTLGTLAVTATVIQTPGLSQLFGCTPLGPVGWAIALGSSSIATGAAVVLRGALPAGDRRLIGVSGQARDT